ncbi:nucleotide-binding domain-containing protein [Mycena maculata]|uniref:Nucleotide-binding domain-containing protein n=1 Tax=Mycena maculata TaxID=230809 RepID=A0AAD7IYB8_9AGAR|nr:nucleotide-binding domain-containing protein [Mycena maculata]
MGTVVSRVQLIYQTFKSISDSFYALSDRISRDPGLPVPNPSRSYWCFPPSPLDSLGDRALPEYADVVIIGSGIAGTAVARTLLDRHASPETKGTALRVVMLEARDVCSGATGRNGGHVSPNTYQDYSLLERKYGTSAAQAIIRFRLAHLPALLEVAEEEGLLEDSQARTVEQFDVYLQDPVFREAREALRVYVDALPEQREKHTTQEDEAAFKDLQLSEYVTGCISQPGGALHPYRLVTGILSRLVSAYPSFHLLTHMPCTAISTDANSYVVSTPKGTIRATHVVHAANAWTGHLLPGMRRKIVPVRVHMSAQRPGRGLLPPGQGWAGNRAFVFYPGSAPHAFDYLTQQPVPSSAIDDRTVADGSGAAYPAPAGELMFGGGASLGGHAEGALLENIGIVDDTQNDFVVAAYLGGALERYFAPGWGADASADTNDIEKTKTDGEEARWGEGRMTAAWCGIMGLSADGQPWVGRVPYAVSQRSEPTSLITETQTQTVQGGEWIAAGFTGEGMTHAWLCGVALAGMIRGESSSSAHSREKELREMRDGDAALPSQFVITERRWDEADFENFLAEVGA